MQVVTPNWQMAMEVPDGPLVELARWAETNGLQLRFVAFGVLVLTRTEEVYHGL